ncbi:hypothetical protein AGMMS49928_21820 [Spirochaetia bacterium]|nr:hypothetical protein AGMMS49928_21820 [Spirochaetia bacterium]
MKNIFLGISLLLALFISACTLSTESAVREVLGSTAEAPVFLGYKAVSEREIDFQFSLPVKVVSLNFDVSAQIESTGEGTNVAVILGESLGAGVPVTADLLVEDENKNTLNVVIRFRTRNDRIPQLLITELRTEYSGDKVEFVELRTQSKGNLGALRLFCGVNSIKEPLLEFSPVEVDEGEYLVIHLRTKETETGWANETGSDLTLSKGTENLDTARDFWLPESKERLRKTDAVYLMDQDDNILDAVLLSETADTWWAKQDLADVAELCAQQGAWTQAAGNAVPGPADAVISKTTTNTRSISRDETTVDTNTAADWYITVASGATPGKANNPNRYVPK